MKKFIKILCSTMVTTSMLLSSVSVFANTVDRVVKISIGNKIANVNGENVALNVAPYVQKPSDSMMIPLRFVSTALGIPEENIQYNPINKEITINYNGRTVKFIANTNKLILNGESFDMFINNTHPVYTEIKNGNTFIPLRALESAFGIKIDWESSTKTAIMTNTINIVDKNVENNNQPIINETETNTNENISNEQNKIDEIYSTTLEEDKEKALIFLNLLNEEREKQGLQPVEISDKLMETARKKAIDMAINKYFDHTDPNGYTMAIDLGVAENLSDTITPEYAFSSWINSTKGHKENMLSSNTKYIGISFYHNSVLQMSNDGKWVNEN